MKDIFSISRCGLGIYGIHKHTSSAIVVLQRELIARRAGVSAFSTIAFLLEAPQGVHLYTSTWVEMMIEVCLAV